MLANRRKPRLLVWMETVSTLLDSIAGIGRDPVRGGYSRPVFSAAELELRSWFTEQAQQRGLTVETDRNGILWAWWGEPQEGALVTGSHLDSVPGGGAFDGPLGIAGALAAVDVLRGRGVEPRRPLAITVFPEEEGSRFGVACLGTRLLTGAIDPDTARRLKDTDGNTFADVCAANGIDPGRLGPDPDNLRRIGDFVELHLEQGRGLADLGHPVAIGSSILAHGRWKLAVAGQGNHAGTTLMADRADPMVAAAHMVLAVQKAARAQRDARATVGRLEPVPGGTNAIPSRVDLWLDVRHPVDEVLAAVVEKIHGQAQKIAAFEGCTVTLTEESSSPAVQFDRQLQRQLEQSLPGAPVLATGAGHDAGILSAVVPAGMLFVRNPTGISHSPEEFVEPADADAGAEALADVIEDLV
jgi:beta-ureidopropionase / N-carbamoyl-L-amino-acid hydrolase